MAERSDIQRDMLFIILSNPDLWLLDSLSTVSFEISKQIDRLMMVKNICKYVLYCSRADLARQVLINNASSLYKPPLMLEMCKRNC